MIESPHSTARRDDVLLRVRDLRTYFHTSEGTARAVDGVSFELHAGVLVARLREYEASVRRERADLQKSLVEIT